MIYQKHLGQVSDKKVLLEPEKSAVEGDYPLSEVINIVGNYKLFKKEVSFAQKNI